MFILQIGITAFVTLIKPIKSHGFTLHFYLLSQPQQAHHNLWSQAQQAHHNLNKLITSSSHYSSLIVYGMTRNHKSRFFTKYALSFIH